MAMASNHYERFKQYMLSSGRNEYLNYIENRGGPIVFYAFINTYIAAYEEDSEVLDAMIREAERNEIDLNLSEDEKKNIIDMIADIRSQSYLSRAMNFITG